MSCIYSGADIHARAESPLLLLPELPETAEFCGRWLLKAAEANKYLLRYMRENPEFWEKLSGQLDGWSTTPSFAALALQSKLVGDGQLDILAECAELIPGFCALAALGFFTLYDGDAQMAVPQEILEADVVRVFSKLTLIEEEQWQAPQAVLAQLLGK